MKDILRRICNYSNGMPPGVKKTRKKSNPSEYRKLMAAFLLVVQFLYVTTAVFAAGQTYNTVTGGRNLVIFEKYLTMDQEANVPNVSFQYSIRAGEARPANPDQQILEIYSGNDRDKTNGDNPVIAANQAVFHTGDHTYTTIQPSSSNLQSQHLDAQGYALPDHLTLGDGKKYAKKEIQIDFSSVQYKEPGIYRYIVEETPSSEYYLTHGITDDEDRSRILDVYVIDDDVDVNGKPKLKIQGYVFHNLDENTAILEDGSTQTSAKPNGFSNDYRTWNLTISKRVDGNQASRDEYFAFTVHISDAIPGTKYDITGNYDLKTNITAINTTSHQNPTELIIPGTGTQPSELTQVFWLQHGQKITINGLAENTNYQVYEDAAVLTREGYTPSAMITGDTRTGDNENASISMRDMKADGIKTMVEDTGIRNDTEVAYQNMRKGVIPTGVVMMAAPFAIVTLLGGLGVLSVTFSRKRREGNIV